MLTIIKLLTNNFTSINIKELNLFQNHRSDMQPLQDVETSLGIKNKLVNKCKLPFNADWKLNEHLIVAIFTYGTDLDRIMLFNEYLKLNSSISVIINNTMPYNIDTDIMYDILLGITSSLNYDDIIFYITLKRQGNLRREGMEYYNSYLDEIQSLISFKIKYIPSIKTLNNIKSIYENNLESN